MAGKRTKKDEPPMKHDLDNPKYVEWVLTQYGRKSTGNCDVDRINARNLLRLSDGDARGYVDPNYNIDGASEDHRGD